jgi:putative membrane protein
MKKNTLLAMMLLAAVILQCCQPADRTGAAGDETTAVDHTRINSPGSAAIGDGIQTAMFLEKAALMIKLETEWGRLAREKGGSLRVRNFGKGAEEELTTVKMPLNAIAAAKGLKLPDVLPVKEQVRLREMNRMEKEYFDKLYLKMVLEDYRKNIELFKGAVNSPDTMVSNFARRFLPVLEKRGLQAVHFSKRYR